MSQWKWPGLRVHGPPLPHLDGIDTIACNVGLQLSLTTSDATPLPFELHLPELGPAWWTPPERWLRPTETGWEGSFAGALTHGRRVPAGKWELELVDDAGALVHSKRVRSHVFCRPLGVRSIAGRFFSSWLLANDPDWWVLLDDVGYHRLARVCGVPLTTLAGLGAMDPPLAKSIAQQAWGQPGPVVVGFNGRVYGARSGRTVSGETLFGELCPQQRYSAVTAAAVDDVAALVRSADPVGWQREQLLREECELALLTT